MTKKVKAMLGETMKVSSNNYPETLALAIVINTPKAFKALWAFLKGFLDEKTRKKVIMLGSKY